MCTALNDGAEHIHIFVRGLDFSRTSTEIVKFDSKKTFVKNGFFLIIYQYFQVSPNGTSKFSYQVLLDSVQPQNSVSSE